MCSTYLLDIDYVIDILLGPKLTQKTQSFVGDTRQYNKYIQAFVEWKETLTLLVEVVQWGKEGPYGGLQLDKTRQVINNLCKGTVKRFWHVLRNCKSLDNNTGWKWENSSHEIEKLGKNSYIVKSFKITLSKDMHVN